MTANAGLLLPCLRGVVGDWVYYSTVMTARQVSEVIRPSGDIREAKELEDHLQRNLGKRVHKVANYLRRERAHFFPSMVVGVFGGVPAWYEFNLVKSKIAGDAITALEAKALSDSIGLLRLTGTEEMFAIDGQHRAAAIKEALASDRRRRRGPKALDDDQFSVMLVAHKDDDEGKKRSRRLFADINKRAVPVSLGDLAIIDEEEVAIIAARRIYAQYGPFARRISLTPRGNLDADDVLHITNLLTLVQVNKKLKRLYAKAPRTKQWEEVNVTAMYEVAVAFYEFLLDAVQPLASCLRKGTPSISILRTKRRHLLARPVGWVLMAQLYARFAATGRTDQLRGKLQLLDMDLAGGHFNNVLWSGGKMEPKNRRVAHDLCLYLFGEPGIDSADLRREYRRILKDETAKLPAPL